MSLQSDPSSLARVKHKPLAPGHLLMPFGRSANPIATILEADHALCSALLTLSCERMHLIALALAQWPGPIDQAFARLVIEGPARTVIDRVLRRRPAGLKRALNHLPVGVLPEHSYRQLVELLEARATAKLLHHVDAITEGYLGLLHSIPAPLRRITATAFNDLNAKPEGFSDGLRLLVACGAAPSFDALIADLAAIRQPLQFLARIRNLVRQLPLPDSLPPLLIGGARHLDDTAEICRLAKRWKNCLADYYCDAVDECRSAIYLWPDAEVPAVCVVNRHGRLGWALQEAAGPENASLPRAKLHEICCAFAAAGIPQEFAVEALEHAAHAPMLRQFGGCRHRQGERDAWYEDMYEDAEAFAFAAEDGILDDFALVPTARLANASRRCRHRGTNVSNTRLIVERAEAADPRHRAYPAVPQ
jgi:hypothetical protein